MVSLVRLAAGLSGWLEISVNVGSARDMDCTFL